MNNNSTYKRLGDYIREVDVRNSEREVNLSQGICNQKYFQNPRQVSATPHLDKIVRKGQFAYNRATTRNGNKISIAYREGEDCTVSSAYCVFYIIDEEKLNPYYLWLWFKHPDFDRYAIFKSHGSAHEFFEFETLCDTYVPIPPIEEQRKIVDHYLAIQNRIANNKQTIAKLEEAAQALYRKMFVDGIDVENLPDGWRMGTLGEVITTNEGKKVSAEIIRYYDTSSVTENNFSAPIVLNKSIDEIPSRAQRPVKNGDILYSTVRPNLHHYGIIRDDNCEDIVVSTGFLVIRSCNININNELLYLILTDEKVTTKLTELADMSKATYPSIVVDDIKAIRVALPQEWNDEMQKTQEDITAMYNHIAVILREQKVLIELLSMVMA